MLLYSILPIINSGMQLSCIRKDHHNIHDMYVSMQYQILYVHVFIFLRLLETVVEWAALPY